MAAAMPASPANSTSLSARAWKEFVIQLEQAGNNILNEFGAVNARERAEGFRYLSRLVSIGLDLHLEHADAAHPTFTRMITDTRKFIGDNPDAEYDYVTLDGERQYRIRGKRGVSTYLAFCAYGKNEAGGFVVGTNLSDATMTFDENEDFELFLSADNPNNKPNWLKLDANTTCMIVRQYFTGDRSRRGTYQIEALTAAPKPLAYSEDKLKQQLHAVGEFVRETSAMSAALSIFSALNAVSSKQLAAGETYQSMDVIGGELNTQERPSAQQLAAKIDPKIIGGHMPTPDIKYNGAWWSIQPDEAVLIEGKPIEARYWSLQIFNRWLESPDYRFQPVSINDTQVQYEADGSFVVVLSHQNPGVKNWISTDGFSEGQIGFRALLTESAPQVTYRIEKLAALQSKRQTEQHKATS